MNTYKVIYYAGKDKLEKTVTAPTHLQAVKKAGVKWDYVLDVIKI